MQPQATDFLDANDCPLEREREREDRAALAFDAAWLQGARDAQNGRESDNPYSTPGMRASYDRGYTVHAQANKP
jgi:hypothetical protein